MANTRKPCVPKGEQLKLINECRSSGMTDIDWCREHGIAVSTFYYWVKQLRRESAQIPEPAYGHSDNPRPRQNVVPIDIIPEHFPLQYNGLSPDTYHTLEIILGSATIRVSDKTDPELLSRTLHPRKKKATHADLFKGLTVHKQVIPLAEEDKICPVCGTPMERIGEEYVRRELVFTPARCEIYEYYTESYGCPICKEGKGDTEKAVIIKSKAAPMQTAYHFTVRRRTGRNTGQPSAVQPLQTGSSTVRSIISSRCMITSTVSFCRGSSSWQTRPGYRS